MDVDHEIQERERLMRWVAQRTKALRLTYDERLQAARIGCWRAILRYDPSRGVMLDTFAVQAMINEVRKAAEHDGKALPCSVAETETPADDGSDCEFIERLRIAARSFERTYRSKATWTHADILDRLLTGETMAGIGRHYGLSRERVRQIVEQIHARAKELCDA